MDYQPNILIVDDIVENLVILKLVTDRMNVNLIQALSGSEALEKTHGIELTLAIIDVNMPGMNGYELAFKMNEERTGEKVPVIFITASLINEIDMFDGYNVGAVDYILKPVNRQILKSKIKIFLDLFNQKQTIIREAALLKESAEELTKVNAKLVRSEGKYRSLIEQSIDGIAIADENGVISEWNKALEVITGLNSCDIVGKQLVEVQTMFNPKELKDVGFFEHLQRGIEDILKEDGNRQGQTIEQQIVRTDGSSRFVQKSSFKIQNGATKMIGMIMRDITDRKLDEVELRLRSEVLENMEEGVFLIRASDGIIVYTNPKVDRIFGYDVGELVGKHISIIYAHTEKSPEETATEIIKYLQVNRFWQGETPNIRKDGTKSWGQVIISTFEHPQYGNVWISIHQDITGRKMAEQSMEISEEKYRTMLNASPDGILLINLKGIITEVSEIGVELFGSDTKNDLVGKEFSQLVPADEKNTAIEIIEKTMNEGFTQNIGLKFKKKNQSIFAGETSSTLIQSPDGTPLSFMITIRDISQRKKMETKQAHADRMANLGQMAAGIAHEINQPLNIISLVMDKILFESAKTETINIEFLKNKSDKIFDNITRIRNIIDHIRAFSRSQDDYVLTAFDINLSIENATSMIMEQFKHLGIRLYLQLEKNIPQIIGNTFKFEQVIINLLANSKDAVIEKKSKYDRYFEMTVGIKTYRMNQFLMVEITDNGIGISDDDIHNIILPFYTTKDEGKGTGLGLSICYQIIKEMNGTIDITSNRVNGTKIKLFLDIQKKK